MIILGIQEAHDASAALMIDGEIVAAVQEERFTGLKGDYGYPMNSVEYCLSYAGIDSSDIDRVVLASHNWNPVLTKIKRNANFSVDDWVKEQHLFWRPTLFENRKVSLYGLFKDRAGWRYDNIYPMDHLLNGYMDAAEMDEMKTVRRNTVAQILGIPLERITNITHEDCHTYYAYFGSPIREHALVMTSEGFGDFSNGTVSRFTNEQQELLSFSNENHLGHIYQYITLLLGMKPAQHEYKVMGLAPYANSKEMEKSYRVFKDILKVDGLNIVYDQKPTDLYFWFKEKLEGHRFDGIAGGLQKFVEEILCKWTEECCKVTGLNQICFSGGVAQNIKACKSISEIDSVKNIFICPAAGDTSISIGACYFAMWEYIRDHNMPAELIKPLKTVYLGPDFTTEEIEKVLKEHKVEEQYDIRRGTTPEEVGQLLAEGLIIARCCGRMEFGLRALGNRTIMADPRSPQTVYKINSAIKFRDFWMPFTPTILAEREKDYIINNKGLSSPFMTMAFDSTDLARKELIAALHPADFTVRPQILAEDQNPTYYRIIKSFENITGVGGILNTSFNLHGDPIVLGPKEAIYTMNNSELDGLLLNDYLLLRRTN